MGIVRKQSLTNTIIYYLGMLMSYLSMVIVVPRVLDPVQYGLVRLLFPVASVIALFYLLGLPNIIIRFFPFYRDEKNQHGGLLFFALAIVSAGVVVFTLLFFVVKSWVLSYYTAESPLFVRYYYFALPLAVGIAFYEVFNAYCKVNFKSVFPTFLNEVYVRLIVIGLAALYYFGYINFPLFLTFFSAVYFLNPVILAVYLKTQRILLVSSRNEIFSADSLNRLGTYGIFNFFGGATGNLVDKVDVLLVASLLGLAYTGIYSIAITVSMAVTLPAKALALLLNPLVAESFKNNNHEELDRLYKSSSRNQFLAAFLIFILIWANFQSFFAIVKPSFQAAFIPFIILGIGRLFDMVTGINGMLIVTSRYFRTDLIFSAFLLLLTVFCNKLLIPRFHMPGAAAATCVALLAYNVAKYIFVWKKLKLQPFTFGSLKILLFGIAVIGLIYLIPVLSNPYLDIVVRTAVVGSLFLAGLFLFKLSPEMTDMITGNYDKMVQRLRKG